MPMELKADDSFVALKIEELWHNLFRMHSYVEAALNVQGDERPPLLQRADLLLKTCHARVEAILVDTRRLEPLPSTLQQPH